MFVFRDYNISTDGIKENVNSAFKEILSKNRNAWYVACANPHSIIVANKDKLFHNALTSANLLLPDGVGITLSCMFLSGQSIERVAGFEYFLSLMRRANESEKEIRVYFLGSSNQVLRLIENKLLIEYPNVNICGSYSPPYVDKFSTDELSKIINGINKAKTDILWVGMTAPKQEKWIYENRKQLNVSVIGAIGAVFDFYAGTKKRSSAWVQQLGLEWLPRLLREPVRLFKRNFISSPKFIGMVLLEKIKRNS